MGSYDFVIAVKTGKKWLALFWPLTLDFGSFLDYMWPLGKEVDLATLYLT